MLVIQNLKCKYGKTVWILSLDFLILTINLPPPLITDEPYDCRENERKTTPKLPPP